MVPEQEVGQTDRVHKHLAEDIQAALEVEAGRIIAGEEGNLAAEPYLWVEEASDCAVFHPFVEERPTAAGLERHRYNWADGPEGSGSASGAAAAAAAEGARSAKRLGLGMNEQWRSLAEGLLK
jgi:hypothetical protein